MEKARRCAFQANYHLIWAIKCRCKVLLGSVEVRLLEVFKTIASQSGFGLLACRVDDGDHLHVFVLVSPKVCIPEIVRVLKCNSVKVLFDEFGRFKLRFWGGCL